MRICLSDDRSATSRFLTDSFVRERAQLPQLAHANLAAYIGGGIVALDLAQHVGSLFLAEL